MASLPTLPFAQALSRAGSAGPRRIALIGSLAAALLAIGGVVIFLEHHAEPPGRVAKMPAVNPLPGGPKGTPYYEDLARTAAQDKSRQAAAVGESSVAPMPGSIATDAIPIPVPAPALPRVVPTKPVPPAAASPAPASPVIVRQETVKTKETPKLDKDQIAAYQQEIHELLASWSGRPSATELTLKPEETGGASQDPAKAANGLLQNATAVVTPGETQAKRRTKRLLMPAKRGVYGRTIVGGNSDAGGPIVVEAESGPISSLRMSGSFERRENRLVVHLNSITLADGQDEKIDALVVTLDTLETSVASSVDEHYVERFLLPAAAAFVSGLGQAIQQSDSTVQSSALGSVTAYQKLNLGKELGVGAGAAATQIGTVLAQSAPKGPTVSLDAKVDVGVLFLAPLEVDE